MVANIEESVRSRYGAVAGSNLSSHDEGVRAVAEAFGYSPEELRSIPAEANMGLSCGNPTATANLKEGETVVDLGSGGGLDVCFWRRLKWSGWSRDWDRYDSRDGRFGATQRCARATMQAIH
jgi:hypothetical protein